MHSSLLFVASFDAVCTVSYKTKLFAIVRLKKAIVGLRKRSSHRYQQVF